MLQYMKYNETGANGKKYEIPSGLLLARHFAVRLLIIVFMAYATLFLAVATPFLNPHSFVIYLIGGLITLSLCIRYLWQAVRVIEYGKSSVEVTAKGILLSNKKGTIELIPSSVEYCEYTLFGDLVIHGQKEKSIFPISMLSKESRNELLGQFSDMAPSRTVYFKKVYEIGDAVVMAMILAVHIIQFAIQNFYIPTGSMENTLMIGDHLFAEKITFGPSIPKMLGMSKEIHMKIPFISRDIKRGDIIIFHPPAPADEEKDYIKRCIAVAGDEYHIKDGYVYINGVKQEEKYTKGITSYRGFADERLEGIVPKGTVIAMGDNRENSSDSRAFGYVPVERIRAKALVMYFNMSQMKSFDFSRYGLIR